MKKILLEGQICVAPHFSKGEFEMIKKKSEKAGGVTDSGRFAKFSWQSGAIKNYVPAVFASGIVCLRSGGVLGFKRLFGFTAFT